jgi:hypothetical protein
VKNKLLLYCIFLTGEVVWAGEDKTIEVDPGLASFILNLSRAQVEKEIEHLIKGQESSYTPDSEAEKEEDLKDDEEEKKWKALIEESQHMVEASKRVLDNTRRGYEEFVASRDVIKKALSDQRGRKRE